MPAISANPSVAPATQALAAQTAGDWAQAEAACRQRLEGAPDDAEALLDLGVVLFAQGRLSEAIASYQRILAGSPQHVGALNNLAGVFQAAGRTGEALVAYQAMLPLVAVPSAYRVASNYLSALQYHPGLSDVQLRNAAEEIGRQLGQAEALPPPKPVGQRRLGFVSADLCDHPVGFFLLPLLRHLDRSAWQVLLYANGGRQDATARQLQTLGEWRDIAGLSHDAVLQQIRGDGVDVLIDLSGHTAGNRLPVFARRAAPVQVTWLGYFATTGVPAMDYILLDPYHAPLGAEAQFSERIIRLPHSRFCYQAVPFAPPVAPSPQQQNGHVTFGCFNNTAKINTTVLDAWAAILAQVPGSRLILKWRTFADGALCETIRQYFAARNIATDRIELRQQSYHVDVLKEYADIDIALDPFPFTGGQSSCEALWMGVPVVTLPGSRPVSRQTLCFLAALGLERLAAADVADYVRLAVALAGEAGQRRHLRHSLRDRMRNSPLCDAAGFARDFQNALRQMVAEVWGNGPAEL